MAPATSTPTCLKTLFEKSGANGAKARIIVVGSCDTRSLERSSPKWTRDGVRSRRHPARASSVTNWCEAAGEVQGEPEPGEQTGSGEGRTGERKMSESADASIENKVIEIP